MNKEERFEVVSAHTIKDKLTSDYLELEECCEILNQQNQRIAELEEQLKNAIVPKFKVGQEVWFVHKGTEKIHNGIIEGFEMVKLSDSIDEYYRIEYDDVCLTSMVFEGEFIFITKEGAKSKLKELKG